MQSAVSLEVSQGVATITFNRPKTLNAITRADYTSFAEALRAVDKRDDVVVTIWQATGRWFCAGTDVKDFWGNETVTTQRDFFLQRVGPSNTDVTHALSSHTKLLVAALNGPVMGIAAAFLGHFDFIYCMPNTWLSVPFTFLGIIAEGGSSVNFIERMGASKAKEALIFGKRMVAQELLDSGFVNDIFPLQPVDSFQEAVRSHILSYLEGLDVDAVLSVKKLLKAAASERNNPDAANLRESMAQAERMASGSPAERFGKIARKEIKHKL